MRQEAEMVKARDINKDIRSIAGKVGVAVFSYDDIHNENINNEFHYDYEKVIAEVSRLQKITPEEAETQLLESDVLKPLPGGEYEVDVGESTRGGGGLNRGDVFFNFSSKDYHVKYHELAHSLQREYNLFDDEKMNRLYETAGKGLKSGEDKEDKLLDRGDYRRYLNEMHSETFSYAALMLRAENRRDFLWQASQAYNSAVTQNIAAALSFGKMEYGSENSEKFYATKPVMKPMIKAIWKIRKEGRQGEFFDEKGVLKDEKLARLCEDVVMKNAYSPRTLKAFFEYRVLDGHSKEEKGWRGDSLKALAQMPLTVVGLLQENGLAKNIISNFKHKKLVAKQNKKLEKFAATRVDYGNPELTALKEYERLCARIQVMDRKLPGKYIAYAVGKYVRSGLPDCSIRRLADVYGEKPAEKKAAEKELREIRKIITENKGNPYFERLLQAEPKDNELRGMIREKQQNLQKEVTSGLVAKEESYGFAMFPIRKQVENIENFAKKYQLDPMIKKSLLTAMARNPQALDDAQSRDVLISAHRVSNDFLGIKKRKFTQEFNKLMDDIGHSYYSNRGNPLYREALQELSKLPTEKYAEKVVEMDKYEREAKKNKEPVRFVEEKLREPEQKTMSNEQQAVPSRIWQDVKQAQVQEAAAPQPVLSPREQVDAEMAKYGIAKGSYMLFSAEDKNLETGYGATSLRGVGAYLHNQKQAQEAGADTIMGQNNGLTAVYFAKEDVYLVTANPQVAEAMHYSGCKDVGLGVMFSNGEKIINDAGKQAEWQQVCAVGDDIFKQKQAEYHRQEEIRKALREVTAAGQETPMAENSGARPAGKTAETISGQESVAVSKTAEIGVARESAAASIAATAPTRPVENKQTDLRRLMLEKSGRVSVSSAAPVQKNNISLQVAKFKSNARD